MTPKERYASSSLCQGFSLDIFGIEIMEGIQIIEEKKRSGERVLRSKGKDGLPCSNLLRVYDVTDEAFLSCCRIVLYAEKNAI